MSARFLRASSQRIINSAPALVSTGYPFSVGFWANQISTSGGVDDHYFAFADTAVNNHSFTLLAVGGTTPGIRAQAGGTGNTASTATALTVGTWNYFVGRFISATNRKIAVRLDTGVIEHATTATSRAPTSLDTIALGIKQDLTPDGPADVMIGEFWYTDTDIQPDGAQLSDALLYQLAFGGPFAVPHIAKDIIEYRSLRAGLISADDVHGDVYFGRGIQTWTNTNGATLGPHCPLPYSYVKPTVDRRFVVI